MRLKKASFTLIEVLVFVSIISLFFVTAATITTYMIRNLKIQEHKILATRYAEELLEWLKGEKEKDWNIFTEKAGEAGSTGKTYCFNEPLLSDFQQEGVCSEYSLAGYFKRQATLTLLNTTPLNTQIEINIMVEWIESGGQVSSVPINTIFSIWE